MANIKFTNFARTALAVGAGSGDVTMSVTGGTGALFPALTAGQYFYAVLENATLDREIVKVTARSTDTLTVTRGQDNTTARAWVAGDIVSLRLNAAAIEEAVVGTLLGANNLSDVANAATARSNIGALASGDNIGAATATTQTTGDNSTKVATTAFVQTAKEVGFSSYNYITTSGALSATALGGAVYFSPSSAISLALPTLPAVGKSLTFYNPSAYPVTLTSAVAIVALGGSGTSLVLNYGDSVTLYSNGGLWAQAVGTTVSSFSKSANGYARLPSGVIIQWGTDTLNSGTVITFPIAFPTACASVTATATGLYVAGVSAVSTTTFTGNCYRALTEVATAVSCKWIAIGY